MPLKIRNVTSRNPMTAVKMFLHFGILLLLSPGIFGEVSVSEAVDGDSRIIGGQDASPGMAKYQVSIRVKKRNEDMHNCGGSIINQQYVLTAAHCIVGFRPEVVSLVVGSHQIKSGGQRYKVKKLVPHEKFSKTTAKNDVGVIEVDGSIQYNNNVQPIGLVNHQVSVGTQCLLTGWGKINAEKNIFPNNLQMLYFNTISNNECTQRLLRTPSKKFMPIDKGQICAKRPNHKGTCQGDSGGPLVIKEGNNFVQIGIVSWGIPCGYNYPDVFASVFGNYNWIQSKIK
ncbi:chymotrypsin-2-like isoform X1 [Pieris rapae]|uniref:chymotrypsin-2-like isoform X1 n=2 Tax=Pieris rapae TaxID=64459 RepID=UPI001E279F1E|nr:chymotrypsin-2-like isoform X1 [Pieris rapae]